MATEDLTWQVFGDLTVLERAPNRGGTVVWLCRCKCGTVKEVVRASLKSGQSKGCQKCIWDRNKHPTLHTDGSRRYYGDKPTHIFNVWRSMWNRCYLKNHKSYKNYGGRGIYVCDEWRNNFQAFFEYVSKLDHYGEEGRTLDRIDNDDGYRPGNVRWATRSEQEHNKRAKRL